MHNAQPAWLQRRTHSFECVPRCTKSHRDTMTTEFKVGDVLRTDDQDVRACCTEAGGNPDSMRVRSIDKWGDPVFDWEPATETVGYGAVYEHASSTLFTAAMAGAALKFRSGCDVQFVAHAPAAKPHCQLVLLNPSTGNIVLRYANGKGSTEPYDEPGDIVLA